MKRSKIIAAAVSLALFLGAVSELQARQKVVLIVMENHEYSSIIGSANAPYLNSLATKYALATQYYANHHPSLPNYLDLVAGSNMGITDDHEDFVLTGNFLGRQMKGAGYSSKVFAESMPASETAERPCRFNSIGSYYKKHNPYAFWDRIQGVNGQPEHCKMVKTYSAFNPAMLLKLSIIIPNICNDMHNCSVATGDTWLKSMVPSILSHMTGKDLLIITWDEGTTDEFGGGHVATIIAGPGAKRGFKDATFYTHYSLLHTLEQLFGLGCLRNACNATVMTSMLR